MLPRLISRALESNSQASLPRLLREFRFPSKQWTELYGSIGPQESLDVVDCDRAGRLVYLGHQRF